MARTTDAGAAGAPPVEDALFEEPGTARCLVGPDDRVIRANAGWLRLAALPAAAVIGAELDASFPGAAGLVRALAARARAGAEVEIPAHRAPLGAGEPLCQGTIRPVAMAGGAGLLVSLRELPSAAPGGREPPAPGVVARLRAIADRAPAAVHVKGADGRTLFANRGFEALLGLGRGEAVGRTTAELFPPAVAERIAAHERRVATGHEVAGEEELPTPAGPRVLFTVRFPLPLDAEDVGIVGIGVDVTERRRAEVALRESEERFRLLANAMPQIVCVLGPDGTVEYLNPSWEAFSGLDLPATARAGWAGVLHPDDLPAALACRRRVLEALAPQDVELRYRGADGGWRWFTCRLAPVVEAGRVVRLVGAGMEIERLKQAEEALRAANARLRDADRRKDEFLGVLSHELRNPLAPLRNAAFILRRAPGSPQADRALGVIERQAQQLTRLVEDLLDVTRIARGKIVLRRARVELGEVARRAAEDLRSAFEERGVALRLDLPADPLHADADAARLAQILGNLLGNALKFTRAGDAVTVALRRAGRNAELAVADTGAGIDPALLPHVFEPFVQAERTVARTQGGLGIGLALVRGLAELHGGTARAESAGQGRGTTVAVTLPLAAAQGTRPSSARRARTAGSPSSATKRRTGARAARPRGTRKS